MMRKVVMEAGGCVSAGRQGRVKVKEVTCERDRNWLTQGCPKERESVGIMVVWGTPW